MGIRYLARVPKFKVETPTNAENRIEKKMQRKMNGLENKEAINLKSPVLKIT